MPSAKPPQGMNTRSREMVATRGASANATAVRRRHGRMLVLGLLAALLLIAALWLRWPEASGPTVAGILATAERWSTSPFAPILALLCFVAGGIVVFPVNLLIAATIVVFGPIAGAALALVGSVLSAEVNYEIGRLLPPNAFVGIAGARGERLRERVVGHGLIAVAFIRIVPIAPYSVVSLIAGAARVRRVAYLIGTALGMAPGILLYALFVDRARAALLDPHPLAWIALGATLALIVLIAFVVRARGRRSPGESR